MPRTLPREERALLAPWNVGGGVPKDRTEAARWFRAAADQGDSTATLFLAHQDRTHTQPAPQKENTDAK